MGLTSHTFLSKANLARASIGAAVMFALYGMPNPSDAQEASEAQQQATPSVPPSLQEVIVTAQRRKQTLESVPYSISVVGADQIDKTGVTDIASLTSQVPGLSIYNLGAQESGAEFPIIRGLNASAGAEDRPFRTFEQSPVATYIDNSPIEGYFQLDDIQRVEVLRGPQGTLYGAGALGGALRIIPNAPELEQLSGNVGAGVGTLAHSSGVSYTADAMLNLPVGDTLAFRFSGKYDYLPGFINAYGILERPGSALSGIPTLADPADPVNSSGIISGRSDWNDQRTFTGRGSVLWQPVDRFHATLAFTYGDVRGNAGPVTNTAFSGGAYPVIDPTVTFPAGGNYQTFDAIEEPFSRRTGLTSLDMSYDAGFATLSSTSSYFKTDGATITDATYGCVAVNQYTPGYCQYYAGNPISPRFVDPNQYADSTRQFTQELRLVSTPGPDKLFDYVLGLFYDNQHSDGSWTVSEPGVPERAVDQGCTAPYYIGASFPNCLIEAAVGDVNFLQTDAQHFEDKSVYGQLTWHLTSRGQITFGGRHFNQSFTDIQSYSLYTFDLVQPPTNHSAPASKNIWMVNPSYQYANDQYVYALWSQGFRRGGANALATQSFFQDNPALLTYKPDTVDNYEAGLKGRLRSGMTYAVDVFDDEWHNPQVAGTLPDGNLGVWNAIRARSTGAEFDFSSPLFISGLSIKASGAYTDARFTQNYSYVADIFGDISGQAGEQLPGSSKVSAAATLDYERRIARDYLMSLTLNDTYRSAMPISTFPLLGETHAPTAPGMNLVNASASVAHGNWLMGLNVTNLADRRIVVSPGASTPYLLNLGEDDVINMPREVDLHIAYSFE